MTYRHLLTRRRGAVEYLALNRPDVRNAFNQELIAELEDWAGTIDRDPDVRVVVLSGNGPVFCAGADIEWMAKAVRYTEDENFRDAAAVSSMFSAINNLPLPVVGRVHGAALGGGAGLAAVCDIVVADEHAVFGFTEVKLGILPAVIAPFVLEKIGRSAARELFLTGARFSAARAREIGLVHSVVSAQELHATAEETVKELLTNGREAMAAAKALIREIWGLPIEQAGPITARAIATRRVSAEAQEGLKAFLERRRPGWTPS